MIVEKRVICIDCMWSRHFTVSTEAYIYIIHIELTHYVILHDAFIYFMYIYI